MSPPLYQVADILQWREPLVRDLAWALLSPPLLAPHDRDIRWLDAAWSRRAYEAYQGRLQALDRQPEPLRRFLAGRPDQRLGSHFEGLLAFWLSDPANTLYRLLGHSLAVRQGQQTLGEIDFLVQDLCSGQAQHWEVAVKFYLGVAPGGAHDNWIGPGLRDRLDLKVARLLSHQLPLSRHPAAQASLRELGLSQAQPVCLLKGQLFYPPEADERWAPQAAAPQHLRGWWMDEAAFRQRFADSPLRWLQLPKHHWLTPVDGLDVPIGEAKTAAVLLEHLHGRFDNRALAVIGLYAGQEVQRGFITPPLWPTIPNDKKMP